MTIRPIHTKERIRPTVVRSQLPKAVLKRLGTLSDAELSRQTDYPVDMLQRCRQDLGIATFSLGDALKSNRHALAIIKAASVRAAAAKLGVSRTAIQKVRHDLNLGPTPQTDHPRTVTFPAALIRQLGKTYDAELARRYGIARTTVRSERQRRSIPAMPNDKGGGRIKLPANILKQLGKQSDRQLAKKAGCYHQTIAQRRKEMGIVAFRPK